MEYFLTFVNGTPGAGITPDGTIPAGAVQCTQEQYENCGQWTISNGAIVAYTAPAPSLAQQAQTALAAGLAVTSTATAALNGTYAVDATAQNHVMAEVTAIMLNGTFADGADTVAWLDISGASHTFTVAQFKTLASAISAYVANLTKCMLGQLAALPAATATIA
jgi:hypothetical protein